MVLHAIIILQWYEKSSNFVGKGNVNSCAYLYGKHWFSSVLPWLYASRYCYVTFY